MFESGGLFLAISADAVGEVIDMPTCQPVPGSAAWFRGVAVYRSRPVAMIDAAAYLEPGFAKGSTKATPEQVFNRAIVIHLASSTYLIAAERILNLCNLPVESDTLDIECSAQQLKPSYLEHRAVKKVCHYENRSLAVIDLPELLRCTKLMRECAFS